MKVRTCKVPLAGFNNLAKSLIFNMYDVCYVDSPRHCQRYLDYIDASYPAARLIAVLQGVAAIIGARVLHISSVDYEPHGTSVAMLVAEDSPSAAAVVARAADPLRTGLPPQSTGLSAESNGHTFVGHLDKSHITIHTYPDPNPTCGINTFRADVDLSTCGMTSPLQALDYLLRSFASDVIVMDYRVRGFTLDTQHRKCFIDHEIDSIQDFIDTDILQHYQCVDVNIHAENIFHTKMLKADLDQDAYLFTTDGAGIDEVHRRRVESQLCVEMQEIYRSGHR